MNLDLVAISRKCSLFPPDGVFSRDKQYILHGTYSFAEFITHRDEQHSAFSLIDDHAPH